MNSQVIQFSALYGFGATTFPVWYDQQITVANFTGFQSVSSLYVRLLNDILTFNIIKSLVATVVAVLCFKSS